MSQPPHNMAGVPDGTKPVPPGPPVLAPTSKRKAAPIDDDHDQPGTNDTTFQSRAMAASKPKASKRPKLSKDDVDSVAHNATNQEFGVQDDLIMKEVPTIGAVKNTKTAQKQKKAAAPVVTKKANSTVPVVADGAKAETAEKTQPKAAKPSSSNSKRIAAISTDDVNDVAMQDAPATAAPKVVTGPISLQALAAGVTTTGPAQTATTVAQQGPMANQVAAAPTIPAPAASMNGNGSIARFFIKPLPAKHTPWPLNCPQAYNQYDQPTTSPINWALFPDVEAQDQKAYDDRQPWNPAPVPWNKVGRAAQDREGRKKPLTDEGGRKRFVKANRAIFQATGVYFKRGTLGLQDESSVPNESDMARALKNAPVVAAQPVTGAGATQSNNGSGAAQIIDLEPRRTKKHKNLHASEVEHESEAIEYELKVVELLLQPPDCSGPVTRHITQTIMRKVHLVPGQTVCCSAATFDRWYSCVCFGLRHSLPKRVYMLKQLSEGYAYVDEGVPPVTIHTLLDTYCFSQQMGTTRVSDMLLDEIERSLRNEAALSAKYGGVGSICEDDCNDVVRLLDLTPEDIEKLWMSTDVGDPIRKLMVDLFVHKATKRARSNWHIGYARRPAHYASQMYSAFAECHRQKAIESFVDALYPEIFCAKYHNHGNREPCFFSRHPSKLSKAKIDDTLNTSNIRKVVIEGVDCIITNNTGDSLDMNALFANKSKWEWDRVQSINSWIYIPPKGPQIRRPQPVYFPLDAADINGRYPSHPGYKNPDWRLRVEPDKYPQDEWEIAKSLDLPDEAQRPRHDKKSGEYLFEIEDDTWIPPPEFARDLRRREGQDWHEFQSYRRWLWTQRGGKIPTMTCKRWMPFMGPASHCEDTFRDSVQQR